MDSQHTAGIRIEGEAKGAVDATQQVTDAQKRLADQTAKTNAVARTGAEESKRFVDRQKEQAQAVATGRHELERMTQSVAAATAAKAALVQVARGLTGVLVGGVVGAITTAALSFVSFGASAEEAGDKAESSAARTSRAWQTAAEAQKTQLGRVRQLQNEIATLQAQGSATDIGFGPATPISAALKGKEAELARLLANVQHGAAEGSGPISIEEATRGLRTASTELAALERRLEAIDTAYGAEINRVGADALMSEAQRAERIAALEAEQGLMRGAASRQYSSFVKGLGGDVEGSDFDRLQKQAHNLLAVSSAAQELTRAQAQLASIEEAYAAGLLKNVTPAQMAQLKAIYETAAANEQGARSAEAARKAANEYAVALGKANDQQIASREGLQRAAFEQQRTLEHEIGLIGKSAGEIEMANAMRQIELELRQAIAATPEITAEQVEALRDDMEVRKRRVAVLLEERRARQGALDGQDGRIRYALDQQNAIDEQATRSAQVFEQAVATGIMLGMRRGSGSFAKRFTSIIQDAIVTAAMTPIATAIARPFGQIGTAFSNAGTSFADWMSGRSPAGAPYSQSEYADAVAEGNVSARYRSGRGEMYEDASGNVTYADDGGTGLMNQIPVWGAVYAGAYAMRSNKSRQEFFDQFGGWRDLFDNYGDTRRHGTVGGALGQAADIENHWFDEQTGHGLRDYLAVQNERERNLMRNMQLTPEQIARVNASLGGARGYDFGVEHTPWEQSQAFTQIQADRLNSISQALGKSIEQLTSVMSLSAEQFEQLHSELQRQLADVTASFGSFVRSVPEQLGITSLQEYQANLATSAFRSPTDRLAAARGIFDDTLARARAGDLDAVQGFPQAAQQLLGIGRDVYASGPQFQELFVQANQALGEVLQQQEALRLDILKDVPTSIMQASKDQVGEIKRQTTLQLEALKRIENALLDLRAA